MYQIMYSTQVMAVGIFITLYGAQWFADCLLDNGREVPADCDPDYITFNFYSTMFTSIEGFISFLLSSFIGRLSDSFGRKLFLIVAIFTFMIPRVTMIFYVVRSLLFHPHTDPQ